ncbi:hypothetical protein Scep_001096 [Stephania cephalantha]|uniref:Uncharacterized protein n=1 Tax=Stephania cephalantha TaxID=152367 RepID=A0AAP0L8E7_9MAGN
MASVSDSGLVSVAVSESDGVLEVNLYAIECTRARRRHFHVKVEVAGWDLALDGALALRLEVNIEPRKLPFWVLISVMLLRIRRKHQLISTRTHRRLGPETVSLLASEF